MRRSLPPSFSLLLLLACAGSAFAQQSGDLQPLPAVPPPPPEMVPFDAALEPQVTIKKREADTVEEFRANGKLYMIKVTPANGLPPYYLIDNRGDGSFTRTDSLDHGIQVPQWIIGTF
ncbi:DUF2782 domain-containing protein [Rhodocyclus tenuis]|uniref:DUF2782 domain-containing protein n=1 Tax=Rhodocyclus tenuis TaxID=1066 RepID=A0A840FX24_RHOTE|nr:DUF2782 domain-containing protein [Rhodocyclus tenuis]MBB4246637.1 hypothetical protein [Rhodocyclus tenuis]MBK1681825.1 hypothetical protein [Rhodocyclus tenuis]